MALVTASALTNKPRRSHHAVDVESAPSVTRSNGHNGNGNGHSGNGHNGNGNGHNGNGNGHNGNGDGALHASPVAFVEKAAPRKQVKVRGMNAALAAGTAPVEVRPHHPMRQFIAGIVIALLAIGAAFFTFRTVTSTGNTFSGVIASAQRMDLNFPVTGRLVAMSVRPGDHVTAGQVLAREDQTVANANLAAAKALVAADEAQITYLQSPQLNEAQRAQVALQVQQAQAGLAGAQQAAGDAQAVAAGSIAETQAKIDAGQALVSADQSQFSAACPNGVNLPTLVAGLIRTAGAPGAANTKLGAAAAGVVPMVAETAGSGSQPASGPPGAAPQAVSPAAAAPVIPQAAVPAVPAAPAAPTAPSIGTQLQAFINCLNLQSQVSKDTAGLSAAQGGLTHAGALAQQLRDLASAAVSMGQVAVNLAQNQFALQSAPGTAAQLAQAQSNLATARATVATDEDLLANTTITAPADGVVANVNGSVGELVGDAGVHTYSGPPGLSSSGPSFSLFPTGPQSSAASNHEGFTPLVSIYQSGAMQVTAEVPESSITNIHPGGAAKLTINALHTTIPVTVDRIVAEPVNSAGTVVYDVSFRGAQWPDNVLPGMSVSVAMG